MLSLLVAALEAQDAEVELLRTFTPGRTSAYTVKSHLLAEVKLAPMSYFLPFEVDVDYGFTLRVKEARPDGFALVEYSRPSMTVTEGETADSAPRKQVEKTGWAFAFALSPINEVTDLKDLSQRAGAVGTGPFATDRRFEPVQEVPGLDEMLGELQALAIFGGGLESALDLSPKLPVQPVRPGDTWRKTVGYQPRKLKGSDRHAVQRLDYEYTYRGPLVSNGKTVLRVEGRLGLDTDALSWILQVTGQDAEASGLRSLRLKLDATVLFDLDPSTRETLRAEASSRGSIVVDETEGEDEMDLEQRLTGTCTLQRVSVK